MTETTDESSYIHWLILYPKCWCWLTLVTGFRLELRFLFSCISNGSHYSHPRRSFSQFTTYQSQIRSGQLRSMLIVLAFECKLFSCPNIMEWNWQYKRFCRYGCFNGYLVVHLAVDITPTIILFETVISLYGMNQNFFKLVPSAY